jgi:mannose-6-phosphate isomerase-like protein (cupin superfamily)
MRRQQATDTRQKGLSVIKVQEVLRALSEVNEEIRFRNFVECKGFTAGLIEFRPRRDSDPRQINHRDKDVVCHVLKGRGRLRVDRRRILLRPGTICHIPKGTSHDFAAGKKRELVLFYSLIKTG